jgi:aspartate aminotransferase-like enzyme
MDKNKYSIQNFVRYQNRSKKIFTPGPGSLVTENLTSLQPCFGRGDIIYENLEYKVLKKLKSMSGHKKIIRMQGSASLALEVLVNNFFYGKILVISTGYYSDRLEQICRQFKQRSKYVKEVQTVDWKLINEITDRFDWIFACYTETSRAIKIPIIELSKMKKRCKSKLALDASASMGLEEGHDNADVIAYSSCKGLFGLTGASFLAYNSDPSNIVDSFYLNLNNHLDKKMTGPYHAIASLADVLSTHSDLKYSVIINKKLFIEKMKILLTQSKKNQPLLCTHVKLEIKGKNKKNIILYNPREKIKGSIVCHLGELHLKKKAKGKILENLIIS